MGRRFQGSQGLNQLQLHNQESRHIPTQCVHRMRRRPSFPNAPIPDKEEDSNLFFADPDASDDQETFNDHIPHLIHFEQENTKRLIDTEHASYTTSIHKG